MYATPTFAGSRPGAAIAATWAALMHVGVQGYRQATKKIIETRIKLQKAVEETEGKTHCKMASNLLFIQIWNIDDPQNYEYWEWGKILYFEKNQTFP